MNDPLTPRPRGGFGTGRASDSTETKAAFKTTELIAYVAILAGLFIAGAITGDDDGDPLVADEVWLFATLLTIGYMISRGLAKSGSQDPYTRHDDER